MRFPKLRVEPGRDVVPVEVHDVGLVENVLLFLRKLELDDGVDQPFDFGGGEDAAVEAMVTPITLSRGLRNVSCILFGWFLGFVGRVFITIVGPRGWVAGSLGLRAGRRGMDDMT